ncbi:MAG: hypothetical protein WA172_06230 [Terriglobales bacterium]
MPARVITANDARDGHLARVAGLAVLASLASFFYYFQRGDILSHGDATAHINIARRVFDSLTPGLLQLGTVWLPLPHLLMIPFIFPNKMWQSGMGGSIPSMIAYVFGVLGIFRLVRALLRSDSRTQPAAVVSAWVASFAYGANPNLIYMQTTALTETLYLTFFIWAMVYFTEFLRDLRQRESGSPTNFASRALRPCACCVACAEMTRYDGWFLAGVMGAIVVVIAARQWRHEDPALRWSALKFLFGIAVAPVLWLVYNWVIYGNPLEFANGPYSAKAIEQRVGAPNPAFHNLWVAVLYFLKAAQATLAVGNWGRFWLLAAIVSSLLALWIFRGKVVALLLLLWAPVPFYAYSIAYGSVPLHVPMWWPFAVFNFRFGLELLPSFAVAAGLLLATTYVCFAQGQLWKLAAVVAALIVTSYAFVLNAEPLCLVEASRNWEMRRGLDTSVEQVIKELPPNSRYLMDLGTHVGIMERLGIPLRRVVNSENRRPWKRPTDPEGIWEHALADPSRYVNYVIAFEGDTVDRGVDKTSLTLLAVIHSWGQPPARIYATNHPPNQSR